MQKIVVLVTQNAQKLGAKHLRCLDTLYKIYKGAYKYYISTLGGWGVRQEMLILLMWLGGVGGQRENAYVKDLNSYPPEKVF